MTDNRARSGRSPRRLSGLQATPDRISGRLGAGSGAVAIVVDGIVRAVLPRRTDAFAWDWPPDLFGRLLDVASVESGASLIGGPVAFEAYRRVVWREWAREGLLVRGRFGLEGPGAPCAGLPIPVELWADGARYGRGFAHATERCWQFCIEIDRLPPGDDGVEISPVIGSGLLAARLHVPASAFEHAGFVEPAEPWGVHGWAARRGGGERVRVALWIDGRKVATVLADRLREDVAAAGFGDGRAGFEIPFPPGQRLDRPALVDVRVAPDGPSLGNSPYLQPAAPPYLGFFDGVDGAYASGWVIGVGAPERPVRVEAVCDGEVVGAGVADLHRADVAQAGLPTARCGFQIALRGPVARLVEREIVMRVAGTAHVVRGSPRRVAVNPNVLAFLAGGRSLAPAVRERLARARQGGPLVSIVMPVHETRRAWLVEAIESVRAQWSGRWELICVDDCSRAAHVQQTLAAFARADPRIRALRTAQNGGIARTVNFGLRAAHGEHVAFLDHDDALEPDAVHRLAQAARESGADLLYSDEALTGPSLDQLLELRARPAFSHDFYLSHPYFVHLVCVRTALARALCGYDETMAISADVDFVLRAIERANAVAHVPRVLYRWRTHPDSAGHRMQGEVMAATQGAIDRHLRRLGLPARVRPGLGFNQFRLDWPDDGGETLIVIPTKDRAALLRSCIESIERTAPGEAHRIVVIDHQSTEANAVRYLRSLRHTVMPYRGGFNFARMNNAAVRLHGAGARYVLFLNNDVEAIAPGWLGRLRSLARRPEVGAVGPLLLYGNGRVQHAGVIVGFGGPANHAMRFADAAGPDGARNPGAGGNLTSVRDYSAVTAACMMLRREAFDRVGGFDERFAVGFNDTDLCLRLRASGLKVLYDGHTVLRHHESATRADSKALADPEGDGARLRARWPGYFSEGDPFYHPLLTQAGTDHLLRSDDGWRGRLQARAVALAPARRLASSPTDG